MRHRSPGYSRPHYHERRFSRSPSPRRGGGGGGGGGHYRRARTAPASLLVRNLRRDCTPGDLRSVFKEFGRIRDIYLPRDYYSGEPRGFGFVEYFDPEDAAEAKYQMDRQVLFGREITVVFAEDNRKRPEEMRMKQRSRGGVSRYHDRSRSRSYSRSRSRDGSVSRGRNSKRYSRSRSRSGSGDRERSRSPSRSPSPSRNSRYGSRSRSP